MTYAPATRRPRDLAERYDPTSIFLHWALVVLVGALAATGIVLSLMRYEDPRYDTLHMWHRSLGELAFLSILASLAWRLRRGPVVPLEDAPWRRTLAHLVQGAITVLLVFVPLTKIVRGAFGLGWAFFWLRLAAPFPQNLSVGTG